MNSNRVTIFTSGVERNVQTLAGILQSYKIDAEIKEVNGAWSLLVDSKVKDGATAIIKKHIKKPGKKSEGLSGSKGFIKDHKVTAAVVILCAAVFCITSFGQDLNQARLLFFSDVTYERSVDNNQFIQTPVYKKEISELKSGQIWRAITPALLHNNLIHFLINIAFIFHLGRIIEKTSGTAYLLILVVSSTILGNFVEYYSLAHPHFGGLNCLVFALLAFVWMRSVYDTNYFGKINPSCLIFVAIWMAAAFLNLFQINNKYGAIASLIFGATWGFLSSRLLPKERLIPRKENLY
jgi:membrane associated rhomboid family serine protease